MQKLKFDVTKPAAPTSLVILKGESNGYACKLLIKYNTTSLSRRWVKVVWDPTILTADAVHNVGGSTSDRHQNRYAAIMEVRNINNEGLAIMTFNAKTFGSSEQSYNDINVPWNTQGYFNAITYDQTYLDSDGQSNPKSNRNYSTTCTNSDQFYSIGQYLDANNLNINYEVDYYVTNQLNVSFYFKGYPDAATNMSKINITCKGVANNLYYISNGTQSASEEFTPPNGFDVLNKITYKLPYNNGKSKYFFTFLTKNTNDEYSGSLYFDTSKIEESIKKGKWDLTKTGEEIDVIGFRKRCAVHISDVSIQEDTYSQIGSFVSKPYIIKTPLYAVKLFSTEIFDWLDSFPDNPENYIRYYINFIGNSKWYRISPEHRKTERWINDVDIFDNLLVSVPKVLIVDSHLSEDEQIKNRVNKNTAYVNVTKEIYGIRLKITIDTSSVGINTVSPKITNYAIKAITRDILKSTLIEEDIK